MRVKSEERRQCIIDVAREAFTQLGFENTSMSEIANRVGGSKATLYNYFSSKEELFAAVIDEFGRQKIAVAFLSLDPAAPIENELNQLGLHYLKFILSPEVLSLRAVIFHEAGQTPIGKEYYQLGPQKGWQVISEYLKNQAAKGTLIPIADPWIPAMHLKGLFEAEVLEPCLLGARKIPTDEEMKPIIARAVRVFLNSYAPRC